MGPRFERNGPIGERQAPDLRQGGIDLLTVALDQENITLFEVDVDQASSDRLSLS